MSHTQSISSLKLKRFQTRVLLAGMLCCVVASGATSTTNESETGFVVRSWNTKRGLPQNTVTALLQTRDGYLWVGTKSGLARFDGVRFRLFGEADGLPTAPIVALLEARDGAVWVGMAGYGAFRWKDGSVTNLHKELSNAQVTALTETGDGSIWIGTGAGLDRWAGGQITHQGQQVGLPRQYVRALHTSRNGTLWAAISDLGIFQLRDGKFVPEPAPFVVPTQKPAYCILEDRAGRLWLSIGNGYLLCNKDGVWKVYDKSDGVPFDYVDCMAETVKGTLWAGSMGEGLAYLDGNRFLPFTTRDGLSDDVVLSVLADREGNLWAGTLAHGLTRLTPKRVVTLAEPEGLTNVNVRSISESADGTLWVTSRPGGLYRGEHDRFVKFTAPIPTIPLAPEATPEPTPRGIFFSAESVLAAKDGTLWLGTEASLAHLAGSNSIIWKYSPQYSSNQWLHGDGIIALAEDATHALWIGTRQGKLRICRNGEFLSVTGVTNNSPVVAIACAPDGTVWAATRGSGVMRLRNNAFDSTLTKREGLGSDSTSCLHAGRDGTIWIGTVGGGLSRWKNGRSVHFTSRQGLPAGTISQILEDDEANLWLGSTRGICRVERSDLESLATGKIGMVQSLTIGETEGMLTEECSIDSSPNCLKSRDGRLYFTTLNGLVVIDPQHYHPVPVSPIVRFEEVVFNGRTISEGGDGEIVIPPGRGNLEFNYTGLGQAISENIHFRYRLVGAERDPDWDEAGTRRTAYYSQLPPGRYAFQVMARAADGLWPKTGASLTLVLQPHFYETWWFYTSLLSGAALALIQVIRVISHRKLQQRLHWAEMQSAVEKERSRIAKDIHDDLGASLTQVILLSEIGEGTSPHPNDVSQTFLKIAEKTRQTVQSLDEIVWAVNPKNDNLPRLLRYICRHADECFDSSNIRCWQKVPPDLPNLVVHADVRHNLFLVVKEALHNVLKHSNATQVWLHITLEGQLLRIEIKDDGCGFSAPQTESPRSGLKNMESRLTEIGGRITLDSQPGSGTRVCLAVNLPTIPLPSSPHGISMS